MRAWPSFLSFQGTTDGIFRAIIVFVAAIVIVKYSSLFEEEYAKKYEDEIIDFVTTAGIKDFKLPKR